MYVLHVKIMDDCPNREVVKEFYENKINTIGYKGDCGVDLIIPATQTIASKGVTKIGLGIQCELTHSEYCSSEPYMLVPRSSISATPLSMANSIGIIDPGYRGQIIAPLRNHEDDYIVEAGTRLFQIVAFDGRPIKIILNDNLTLTERGDGGFGSTNK